MKMETAITARMNGVIEEILVNEGDTVKGGQLLIRIKKKGQNLSGSLHTCKDPDNYSSRSENRNMDLRSSLVWS